jgi:hypothetical protein
MGQHRAEMIVIFVSYVLITGRSPAASASQFGAISGHSANLLMVVQKRLEEAQYGAAGAV